MLIDMNHEVLLAGLGLRYQEVAVRVASLVLATMIPSESSSTINEGV
jgi:hypothetical protein